MIYEFLWIEELSDFPIDLHQELGAIFNIPTFQIREDGGL